MYNCIVVGDPIIKRESWELINRFKLVENWILSGICRGSYIFYHGVGDMRKPNYGSYVSNLIS